MVKPNLVNPQIIDKYIKKQNGILNEHIIESSSFWFNFTIFIVIFLTFTIITVKIYLAYKKSEENNIIRNK